MRRENQHDLVLLRHPEHYIHIGWIIIFRNHDELETAAQSNYAQSLCPKACAPISDLTTTLIDLDTISCQLICYLLHPTSHLFAPAFFNIFFEVNESIFVTKPKDTRIQKLLGKLSWKWGGLFHTTLPCPSALGGVHWRWNCHKRAVVIRIMNFPPQDRGQRNFTKSRSIRYTMVWSSLQFLCFNVCPIRYVRLLDFLH